MTINVKLSSTLPKEDRTNGLGPIAQALVRDPDRFHVVLAVVDCKTITTDHSLGMVSATTRVRRIEAVLRDDLPAAERLMRRALEARSGHTVLPLDLEDDMRLAFQAIEDSQRDDKDGGG